MSESLEKLRKEIEDLKEERKSDERTLLVDLPAEGLESTYYWMTYFLEHYLGYDLEKTGESIAAAVASSFFSDLGGKKTRMEQRAKQIIVDVNTVVKSILNLIYDLKEFDRRLEIFDDIHSGDKDKKEAGEIALKSVWMDEVDTKRGVGSINQLTASGKLEFVTLRDAFLQAKSVEDVENLDLNKRVKRIVKARIEEYKKWRKRYETDLRQRRKIEKSYLKAQVRALKEYTKWAKPYLIAAQKLRLSRGEGTEMGGYKDPHLVEFFDTATISVSVRATKKQKLKKHFSELQVGRMKRIKDLKNPVYRCIELDFVFGSKPVMVSKEGGANYRHMGQIMVKIKGYAFTKAELEKIRKLEEKENLELVEAVEEMTTGSLEAVSEDLEKYLSEEEEEEETPSINLLGPLEDIKKGAEDLLKPFTSLVPESEGKLRLSRKEKWMINLLRDEASKKVSGDVYNVFKIYRKSRGYITFRGS